MIVASSSAARTASEYARTSPPAPRRVPPNQRVTTATRSLTSAPRRTSSMGAPAVPAGSPSSEERCTSWPAPRRKAEQWWRASQYLLRAPATTSRAASSDSTRVSSPRNRDRLISNSAEAGAAMVRYMLMPPLCQRSKVGSSSPEGEVRFAHRADCPRIRRKPRPLTTGPGLLAPPRIAARGGEFWAHPAVEEEVASASRISRCLVSSARTIEDGGPYHSRYGPPSRSFQRPERRLGSNPRPENGRRRKYQERAKSDQPVRTDPRFGQRVESVWVLTVGVVWVLTVGVVWVLTVGVVWVLTVGDVWVVIVGVVWVVTGGVMGLSTVGGVWMRDVRIL